MTPRELSATLLIEHWYSAGFLDDLDRALARFLKEQVPDVPDTLQVLAALTSRQLRLGHSCLPLQDELPESVESLETMAADGPVLTPTQWWRRVSLADKKHALQQSPLVVSSLPSDTTPLMHHGDFLYLRRAWRAELQVATAVQHKLAMTYPIPDSASTRLARLFPPPAKGSTASGTDWQKVACALALRSGFTLITGGPGTGKTTTVVRLLALLQWQALDEGRALRIHLAAPTGKAAARLKGSISQAIDQLPVPDEVRESIPREVSTLHKLLGSQPASRHFIHRADNPLHTDVVVVDEASMLDLDMAAALMTALPPHSRLILLGDKDQLASVEAGAILGDLCAQADPHRYTQATCDYLQQVASEALSPSAPPGNALGQQTAMLRDSHRFAIDSGIGQLALAVNQGHTDIAPLFQHYPDLHWLRSTSARTLRGTVVQGYRHVLEQLSSPPTCPEDIEPWIRNALRAQSHFQVLCAVRAGDQGVENLNLLIAQWLFEEQLIPRTEGWYPGRPIMVARNDYASGLMNGDTGLTLNIPEQGQWRLRAVFLMPDNSIRQLLPSRLEQVETVYAMTVHKSQGSEFNQVLMVLPDHASPLLTRELVYTAITRARERFILSTGSQLLGAFPRTRRHSGLQSLLQEKLREQEGNHRA